MRRRSCLPLAVALFIIAAFLSGNVVLAVPGSPDTWKTTEPVATMIVSPSYIDWQPYVEFAQLILTVSGPGDAYFRQVVEAGSFPYFELLDNDGKPFPDGSCTYELVVVPIITLTPEAREALAWGREYGDDTTASELRSAGLLPQDGLVQSGNFLIQNGAVVTTESPEVGEVEPSKGDIMLRPDQVIYDDLIVDGSLCVGFDCVNGESFGFDTIRLKENNLRIKFQDTSSAASYPTNDWQITANDSTNGGKNKFSIDDIDGGRTPFTIEAGAPSHSLYVEDYGRVGLGTSTPSVELHVVDGDTPTVRLEQDGSSGWAAQTWDVAGNETNFFIRDVTNGSKLPFRIRPSAPSSSIDISASGQVGIGTASPAAPLHVKASLGDVGTATVLNLENNGRVYLDFNNNASGETWRIYNSGPAGSSVFYIVNVDNPGAELYISQTGDLSVLGTISSGGTQLNVPDYVFEQSYPLMSLPELAEFVAANKHLPNMPSSAEVAKQGVNLSHFQMKLLEKIEELTLHTLAQQETINQLRTRLTALEKIQEAKQ